jgi:hypothetical protein
VKVDGRCHCGRIRFEAEVDPEAVGVCHCSDCQTLTGSTFRANVQAPAESFVLHGEPRIYLKTADSGRQRAHAFCPDCGTPIYAAAPKDTPTYSLRIGTLRQRREFGTPKRQIWCDSAVPWAVLGGVPKLDRQ